MTMMCTWMNKPITITNCQRERVRVAQAVRARWLGALRRVGRRCCRACRLDPGWQPQSRREHNHQRDEKYQPHNGSERMVQMLDSGSFLKHRGDVASAQHVRAFQRASTIGKDYGGISDAHNMVVVVAKRNAAERHGGASKPAGRSMPPAAAARTEGANRAAQNPAGGASDPAGHIVPRAPSKLKPAGGASEPAGAGGASEPAGPSAPPHSPPATPRLAESADQAVKNLARLLEDQPKGPEHRRERDGLLYTKEGVLVFWATTARTIGLQRSRSMSTKWGGHRRQ